MQVHELTLDERQVLFGLLAHLAAADAKIDPGEAAELEALGEEMGVESLRATVAAARSAFATAADAIAAADGVQRPDARQLIRTLLHDLAGSDGVRSPEEQALLDQLSARWGL
ncbi:MAG: TerB family tellurite resistance protein [Myxococcota bacterium]